MPYSAYLQDKINDHLFKGDIVGTAFVQPTKLFLKLHNADPGPTNFPSTEISGGDYVKQQVLFSTSSAGYAINAADITYLTMPGTTVTHVSIWDENDNMLIYDAISDLEFSSEDDFIIQANALKINAKNTT